MTLGVTGPAAWAERTYGEVRSVAEADGSVLVVPVGSVEQHGHHLPVATDSILVAAVAERAVEEASEVPVLATPTVWTGHSPHHLPFGGTISLDADAFLEHLSAVVDSALDEGFDAVLVLNGHGGNAALVDAAASAVGPDRPDTEVLALTYFELAGDVVDEVRDSDPGGMAHGGEFETSLMLRVRPDLVDESRLEATPMDEPYDRAPSDLVEGGPLAVYRPFTSYSESGAVGDPGLASEEKGRRLLEALGSDLGDLLVEVHERNR